MKAQSSGLIMLWVLVIQGLGALTSVMMMTEVMIQRQVVIHTWHAANAVYALDRQLQMVLSQLSSMDFSGLIHPATALGIGGHDCGLSKLDGPVASTAPWHRLPMSGGSSFRMLVVSWPEGVCIGPHDTGPVLTVVLERTESTGLSRRLTAITIGESRQLTYWHLSQP